MVSSRFSCNRPWPPWIFLIALLSPVKSISFTSTGAIVVIAKVTVFTGLLLRFFCIFIIVTGCSPGRYTTLFVAYFLIKWRRSDHIFSNACINAGNCVWNTILARVNFTNGSSQVSRSLSLISLRFFCIGSFKYLWFACLSFDSQMSLQKEFRSA